MYYSPRQIRRGVAQSGSAPVLGAGCRGFKSLHPDHADLCENPYDCCSPHKVSEKGVVSWFLKL